MDNSRKSGLEDFLTPEAEAFMAEWRNGCDYVVVHTSGSTGRPKEIRLLKSDMLVSAKATNEFFGIGADSLLVLPLSPDYIAGKMLLVRAAVAGAKVRVENPSREPLSGYFPPTAIDLVPIVPAQIDGLLSSKSLPMIKNVIVGGAPMSAEDERKLVESGVNAYATFGMTETCSHVALRRVGEAQYVALPGFRFSTDDRQCLVVESDRMSFGRLVTNYFVEVIDGSRFVWVGRFDNVIITGAL
ncbi:MAG: AMP-binding protein, partial [Duncaniella sp.]|nr:AMP-binding protein [Duncaniella sp.]